MKQENEENKQQICFNRKTNKTVFTCPQEGWGRSRADLQVWELWGRGTREHPRTIAFCTPFPGRTRTHILGKKQYIHTCIYIYREREIYIYICIYVFIYMCMCIYIETYYVKYNITLRYMMFIIVCITCMLICIYCVYIYIYIYRERERDVVA